METSVLASQQQQQQAHQQQQQLSSQSSSSSTKHISYSPEPKHHIEDNDEDEDDAFDNTTSMCLQNLSTTATNNNNQNINFNLEALAPNPPIAVGFIQNTLDKRVIERALQLLQPIKQQLDNMSTGGNGLSIKNELNDDDDDMGDQSGNEDDFDVMDMDDGEFIANEAIFENDLISPNYASFNLQTPTLVSSYFNVHYVCESGSRIIFLTIVWLRKVPAFVELSQRAQITLLRSSWPALLAISLAQVRTLSQRTLINTLISNVQKLADIDKIDPQKIKKLSEHIARLNSFIQNIQSLECTDMEYALLRFACLFNSHCFLRRKDQNLRSHIQRIQQYSLNSLRKLIMSQAIPAYEADERFNRLVLNLMPLSALESDSVEDLFFSNLVGQVQIDNMIPYILTLSNSVGSLNC